MRKIIVATFMTLDGVLQAPGGPEEDRTNGFEWGGWQFAYSDEMIGSKIGQIMSKPFDLLLGRRTYEIFAAYWPYKDDAIGAKFNSISKYVARSKSLLGPWEKYARNPVLKSTSKWNCPGHGTPIEKDGRYYFLYHAYDKKTNVYTGRQGLLQEFVFDDDGWISFVQNEESKDVPLQSFSDNFNHDSLNLKWQWSVFKQPNHQLSDGKLRLTPDTTTSGSYIGIATTSGTYTATVQLEVNASGAKGGLGIFGDDKNLVNIQYSKGLLKAVSLKNGREEVIASQKVKAATNIYLRAHVTNGSNIQFFYSVDGKVFKPINKQPADGSFLPPWDRSLRVGLISKGDSQDVAVFDNFQLENL